MRTTTGFLLTCIAAAAFSWVVALGGIAAVTNDCYKALSAVECARGLQYEWWGLWFEFFLLIIVLYFALRRRVEHNQSLVHTFFGMCTTVLMWSARSLMMRGTFTNLLETRAHAQDAAAAGFVMLCLFNFLIIIAVSMIATGSSMSLPQFRTAGGGGVANLGGGGSSASDSEGLAMGAYSKFTDNPVAGMTTTSAGGAGVPVSSGGAAAGSHSPGLNGNYFTAGNTV